MPLAFASGNAQQINFITDIAHSDSGRIFCLRVTCDNSDKELFQNGIGVVPRATELSIIMATSVSVDTSEEGDEFAAFTSEDTTSDGSIVVPKGSVIKGRIASTNPPLQLNRSRSVALALKFDSVNTPDNRQFPLVAHLCSQGGMLRVQRGVKNIAIETNVLLGGFAGAPDDRAEALKLAERLRLTFDVLHAKKGTKIDLRPGDELKIELVEDLRIPPNQVGTASSSIEIN